MADWRDEIEGLHAFFQGWLGGELPAGPESFARMEEAMARDFTFVTTGGELLDRAAVVEGVRSAHGARPGLRIEIRDPRLLHAWEDRRLAVYEEWQEDADGRSARTSTVLFRRSEDAPTGLAWVHVHETMIREEPGEG